MAPPRLPWNAQIDEKASAFRAFQTYLNLGPTRSIEKAWRMASGKESKTPGHFTKWAQEYKWTERAEAWDLHAHEVVAKQNEETMRRSAVDLTQTRINAYRGMMNVGARIVVKAAKAIDGMTPQEALAHLPIAAQLINTASAGLRIEFGANPQPLARSGLSVHVQPNGEVNVTALFEGVQKVLDAEAADPLTAITLPAVHTNGTSH